MRPDKQRIFQLRREGRTYREIHRDTGVSRATLSTWFKGEEWSKQLSSEHFKKNIGGSKERMERMNMVRKLRLQYQYALVEKEAEKEYQLYRKDPLFWAGLMIYAGEGDRQSRHFIRITNTDFSLHKIFLAFSLKYLGISREKLRVCLSISSILNESLCREMWANLLGISREQFYKTQVIKEKKKVGRLQYGTGMSIISSTVLKKKIMKWISLAQDENFE